MSSTPSRRPSPAVYRRRRLVLLLALVLVAAVVWLFLAQPWRGSAAEAPVSNTSRTPDAASALPVLSSSPTPTPTPTKTPKPTIRPSSSASGRTPSPAASGDAKPCAASNVLVEAAVDKSSYATGQNPKLSIKLTNQGAKACTFNVGTSTQSFTITSGSDTWWRSTDCQTEPSDMVVLLAPGQTVASAQPIVWDRTRSSVSTCQSTSRPKAAGGGATYHLEVEIGGVPSRGDTMFQLY